MLSLNALKYKVSVARSYYAGVVIFLLYLTVILVSLLIVTFTLISLLFYFILFVIALMVAKKATLPQGELFFSESGLIERVVADRRYSGEIGSYSFYNGFFIFLQLDIMDCAFAQKNNKQFMTIYKDAISEEQYHLIARLINSGRR